MINDSDNVDLIPSNVNSSHQEALLYVFEDNKAVIKMIFDGRSPTMRHVSRTHRVAIDWLFDRINLDPKIQIKYIDTKNQLADILTKDNFTRDEWNHLLSLFNISHFSPTVCSAAMAKRSQQESREERVTAKSRPMMNLIARTPSFVSSSTSVSPEKRSYGSQDPWSAMAHASMTTTSKKKKWNLLGELSQVCAQIVLKCLYLARIGLPDILWSLNKIARSITKLTKACDERLNRLISYIHHTCEKRLLSCR